MNRSNSGTSPMPTPLCAAFAPLLPLLAGGELSAEEARSVRTHLATCDWCQSQLATYDAMDAALRRHYGNGEYATYFLSMEEIMSDSEQDTQEITQPASNPLHAPTTPGWRPPRGPSRRLSAIGAIAAVLLVALFAGTIYALHGHQSGQPTASATATSTVAPTATATVSLATAHRDWITLTNTPAGAANVAFAPLNPRMGLLCTSVNTSASTGQPKLYKTIDAGQSWQEVTGLPPIQIPSGSTIPPTVSCNTFIDATDANDIFLQQIVLNPEGAGVAVARALYRSRDGGATWGQPLGTLARTNGFGQLAVVGSRLVATALPSVYGASGCSAADPLPPVQPSTVLYASDDGGQTWQQIRQPIENQHLGVVGMALMDTTVFALANTLYPGGCSPFQPTTSLWKSSDGGRSWQQVTTPSPYLDLVSFTPRADGTGYYGVGLAGGPEVRPGAPSTVLFSPDSGATWSPVPGLDPHRTNITDPTDVEWKTLTVTPSGAVVAQVFQYPMTSGSPSGVFAIRPSDPQPAWTSYAPVGGKEWEMTTVATGTTLWALDFQGQTPTLKYLPLP